MELYENVYAVVDLDRLVYNLNIVKSFNKNRSVIAVVKDDAYGHGIVEVSKTLLLNGAKALAVGSVKEGVKLRENGIKEEILVMGITPIEDIKEVVNYKLTQTITGYEYSLMVIEELKKLKKKLNIQIKLETGMGRVGLIASDENCKIVNNIFINPFFNVSGVYSHFSNSDCSQDEYNFKQYNLFDSFCNKLEKLGLNIKYKHMCNSSGSLNFDFENLNAIRTGIVLYGYNHSGKKDIKLKPVMSLKAKIVHIKDVDAGEFIGYGKNYKTSRKSRIATINVGYGHGYPRYLSNEGKVIIKNEYANIVGNVCMDHFMVDITHICDVKMFDEVLLIGESMDKTISAQDIAKIGNTISYEVLCGIRGKVQRIYTR